MHNYIEMLMDKERLDEIGKENIDTEYFDKLILINLIVKYDE